ncbi:hypothetical protein CDA63_17365 [Hymenobacter amundsenii]|uniref:Lipoprotein n=1 Tax=Hymenobacter amundsenii TaxID=2006685 RepID=A0A246FH42_9BACT|nr:hypothetical protein [Hymenobacter amundsenii]OWP61853.1 hypothetical protein CDA63_17365 [Hymenobacter amundsenii]
MRFPTSQSLFPALLTLLAGCSGPDDTKTKQPVATSATAPDTVAALPTPAPAVPDTSATHNVAAYLAGQRVSRDSNLQSLENQPAWQAYATDADKSWEKYHATRTTKIEAWAARELDSVRAVSPTIFYPFSGPDFLNVTTMFPASQTYVLLGLEPVGTVPARATLEDPKLFAALKESLWSVLSFSFFRTNSMAVNLKSVELDGALPLMMLFAARTNHQVEAVRYVQLTPEGQLTEADSATIRKPGPKTVPGVEMKLRTQNGQPKTVLYFSVDISDWKLGQTQDAALKYVRTLGPLTTYVKSATYLMHKAYFSKVRNLVLERSNYVLQDDSGIAMKYFPAADWQFTYYGTYKRPINLFAKQYQPELTAAYTDKAHPPRPLPFGTGYNWRENDSNLLLARRAQPVAQ